MDRLVRFWILREFCQQSTVQRRNLSASSKTPGVNNGICIQHTPYAQFCSKKHHIFPRLRKSARLMPTGRQQHELSREMVDSLPVHRTDMGILGAQGTLRRTNVLATCNSFHEARRTGRKKEYLPSRLPMESSFISSPSPKFCPKSGTVYGQLSLSAIFLLLFFNQSEFS